MEKVEIDPDDMLLGQASEALQIITTTDFINFIATNEDVYNYGVLVNIIFGNDQFLVRFGEL